MIGLRFCVVLNTVCQEVAKSWLSALVFALVGGSAWCSSCRVWTLTVQTALSIQTFRFANLWRFQA